MAPSSDEFTTLLEAVGTALKADRRISYRGLKRRFGLSDEDLEDIKDELIHARRQAEDEAGTVLVWRESAAAETPPAAPALAPLPAAPTIAGYTPRHLAERILSMRSALEGENKQVTVLFCDVAQSMVLAESLGPESWHEVLNAFFTILTDAVHGAEGTVNQYTGDGAMALFGAPVAVEDHARRACIAALKIRDSVAALSARVRAEHGLDFAVRIGLNSGEVVVGRIGDDLRMDYTAQGQVVGIAARLEGMAGPNGILMSEFCHRQLAGLCQVESLGLREIKGVSQPIEVFSLHSVAIAANRFDASRLRGLTRFVGRERDLDVLDDALAQAQAGNGQVVGVVAEAGTGKSRLLHEFQQRCRARGLSVFTGHAVAHGSNIPYLPMLQIFRAFYRIEEQDDAATARRKISDKLLGIDASFAEAIPVVCEQLGVADPDAPPLRIDPDAKQRQLLGLLRQVVQGNDGEADTIVTFIEDLHWLDSASALFLEQWVDSLSGSKNLLVLSFRPEYRADWMHKSYYRQVPLAALGPKAVHEMLTDLLGNDASTIGLADEVFRRTGGNPFFCEEIVQTLRESGDLSVAPSHYRLNRPLSQLQIPASVQSILAARIDRLSEDNKSALQSAAVVGREFSPELMRLVTGLDEQALGRALNDLKQSEFVFERTVGIRTVYSFKHALTQEVALNSQLRDKRRQTHVQIARAMETLHVDKLAEHSAVIGYHLEQAREPLAAAQAYARAASRFRSGDREQHLLYIRKTLSLTEDLPPSEIRHQLRLGGLVEIITGGAWRFTMADEELDRLCGEARGLAEAAGLGELSIMIRAGRCAAQGMMAGDVRSWGTAIDAIVADIDGVTPEVAGSLLTNSSYAHYIRGNLDQGLAQARHGYGLSNDDASFGQAMGFSVLGACLNNVALMLASAGQLDEALAINARASGLVSAAGLTEEWIWHLANQAEEVLPRGLPPTDPLVLATVANAVKASQMAEQVASDFTRGVAKRGLAIAMLMQGRHHEAIIAADDALKHCRDRRAHLEVEARCLAVLAEAWLGAGDRSAALRIAGESIARAQAQEARYFECLGQLARARVLLSSPTGSDADDAATGLARAAQLARDIGALGVLPQVLELQATTALLAGRDEEAMQQRLAALRGYQAINASGHARRLAALN